MSSSQDEHRLGLSLSQGPGPRSSKPLIHPFAGRVGGNQELVLDRNDTENAEILERLPDAAPFMTFRQGFDLRGFWDIEHWKFGLIKAIGTMLIVFATAWASLTKPSTSTFAETAADVYSTTTFLGPVFGGLANWMYLTLFIFTFSNVSGSHLNPTITMAAFFARLVSFPRAVVYLMSQTLGGAFAGLILKAAYGSSDFSVGGCSITLSEVSIADGFLLEFIFCLILIFLSFGVGLDPRQSKIYGPALSPFLVGLVLGLSQVNHRHTRLKGSMSLSTFSALNPARCFGVYVATSFPTYHWIHWVGPAVASIGHGIIYYAVPPWGR